MIIDKLKSIKEDKGFLVLYLDGMSKLYQSGIFDFLQEKGRVRIIGIGENVQVLATQAARSAGYMEALEDLFNFKKLYLDQQLGEGAMLSPDYGALDLAEEKGYLTKEEINAIRNNTKPSYINS